MVFFALVFLTMMLRVGKERQKHKTKKKNQRQTTLERVRTKKNQKNNYLYDACNEYTYDACSNALKFVQFYFINHQKPQILKSPISKIVVFALKLYV